MAALQPDEPAATGGRFTVTEAHLALLARMHVRWGHSHNGPGAPGVDTKRPYGFSGNSFGEIAAVLDPEGLNAAIESDELDAYTDTHEQAFMQVHRQTETVVKILLRNASARPGVYETAGRDQPWVYLGPEHATENDHD